MLKKNSENGSVHKSTLLFSLFCTIICKLFAFNCR